MIAHEERHQAQMQSLRSNANFPKAAVTPA